MKSEGHDVPYYREKERALQAPYGGEGRTAMAGGDPGRTQELVLLPPQGEGCRSRWPGAHPAEEMLG